jgi:tripartite-type tricarboxylate transporter receptor subunit TctC
MEKRLSIVGFMIVIMITLGFSGFAAAKDYPSRPVKLIVAYGAGGGTSTSARVIAQPLTQTLGQPFVIVNKPGAGGQIGAAYAAKARPDGYTLFVAGAGPNIITVAVRPNPGYSNKDYEWIGQYSSGEMALSVRADSKFKTISDLVEYSKKHPGELNFPAASSDSARFATEFFMLKAGGLKCERIPIHGGGEFNQMLLGGNADFGFGPAGDMMGLVMGGKMRFLAFANKERNPKFPDVPTFNELGYSGILFNTFYGLAAPKGVPQDVLQKLRSALADAAKQRSTLKLLRGLGHSPIYLNAEEFETFIEKTEKVYKDIAETANIKLK